MKVLEILQMIRSRMEKDEDCDKNLKFFGYFYLGLYFDALGEVELAGLFLSRARDNRSTVVKDAWYTISDWLLLKQV